MRQHLLITFTILLLIPLPGTAQDATPPLSQRTLSLEIDPAPFLLNGYSFSLRYATPKRPHWSIMASVFSSDFPEGMIDKDDRNAGWNSLHFKPSNALFLDYSLRPDGRGAYVGASVFLYHNLMSHSSSDTGYSFRSIYPNLRIGYHWFPMKNNGLYVSPFVNFGRESILGDPGFTDMQPYRTSRFKYIIAVHIGYRIKWN